VVVDCRPADSRRPRDLAAFEATRRACGLVGWEYRLVGAPDPIATANLRWLSGYRHLAVPVLARLAGLRIPVMGGGSGRHAELADELVEWWEDLWQRRMTSRVVLVAVPPNWGRTTVLNRLEKTAGADDAPVTLIARINGRRELPKKKLVGAQAAALRDYLAEAATRHPVAELLGLDRLGGITQMGVGLAPCSCPGWAPRSGSWSRGWQSPRRARRGMTARPGRTAPSLALPARSPKRR
jgi:hypothetical protein